MHPLTGACETICRDKPLIATTVYHMNIVKPLENR